jgi:dienelactone hydrolase
MNSGNSVPFWSRLLQSQGYATLGPDSFTARGFSEVCAEHQVTPADRTQEVLGAACLLASRPDVRRDRIAVLGESHGGSTTIYTARDHEELRPLRERLAARGGRLVAAVALYGGQCGDPDRYPVVMPLLALSGGKDDWSLAGPCVTLANAQATGIMQIKVYPEAYHAFAVPTLKAYSKLGHWLEYDAGATEDAHAQATEFLRRYLQ